MAGFYSVYMQVHFISVLYMCKIVFPTGQCWLAQKAWPFSGSHDVGYTARLQFSTALYHEAKKFHVVCK